MAATAVTGTDVAVLRTLQTQLLLNTFTTQHAGTTTCLATCTAASTALDSLANLATRPPPGSVASTAGVAETALRQAAAALLLHPAASAEAYFTALRGRVACAVSCGATADAAGVLLAGVHSLQKFLAQNVTGPTDAALEPLWQQDSGSSGAAAASAGLGQDTRSTDDRWVASQLEVNGEDLVGRLAALDRLLAALECLAVPLGLCTLAGHGDSERSSSKHSASAGHQVLAAAEANGVAAGGSGTGRLAAPASIRSCPAICRALLTEQLPTWHWWAFRALMMQQHVLSGRAAALHGALACQAKELLAWVDSLSLAATAAAPTAASASGSSKAGGDGAQALKLAAAAAAAGAPTAALEGLTPQLMSLLRAGARLEVAHMHQAYGYVAQGQRELEAAGNALGLQVSVTGALGRRTLHQVDPKAQLVARITRAQGPQGAAAAAASTPAAATVPASSHQPAAPAAGAGARGDATTPGAHGCEGAEELDVDVGCLGLEGAGQAKELEGMEDDSAVFLAPRLEEEQQQQPQQQQDGGEQQQQGGSGQQQPAQQDGQQDGQQAGRQDALWDVQQEGQQDCGVDAANEGQASSSGCYSGIEQALLLGWALQMRKGSSADELQQWQMAPYAEAVLQQRRSQYMLQAAARLLKARHEKGRPRTRERALLALEQLSSTLAAPQPPAVRRAPFAYSLRFPLRPLLSKELAEAYISLGFAGAALKLYESLEMWDALILCYQLLDKKAAAQEVVLQRLKVHPDEPRLWCALGDLQQCDDHYRTAWERSGRRSARAQRSLARSALRRKDYAAAAEAFEHALALSPMHADAWFGLGYACMKFGPQRHGRALQAFSKVTQLDSEHGEAWNNAAALWAASGRTREAFATAGQAIKHKRESWQAWENYAGAAARAGALAQAARALHEALRLSGGQRLDAGLAAGLVRELERRQGLLLRDPSVDVEMLLPPPQDIAADDAGVVANGCEEVWQQEEEEALAVPEQLLGLLALSPNTPQAQAPQQEPSADAQAVEGEAPAGAVLPQLTPQQRQQAQAAAAVGALLRDAATSRAAGPDVWGLLARWYALGGEQQSAKEAWLKQVRALQTTSFKKDPEQFEAMAAASLALCGSYLRLARESGPGPVAARELSAARMHLRGLLKQCEEAFEGAGRYTELQAQLGEVVALEEAQRGQQREQQAQGMR